MQVGREAILRRATARDSRAVVRLVRELGWTLSGSQRRGGRGMGGYGGWKWGILGCCGLWMGVVVAQGGWPIAGVGALLVGLLWGLMEWYPLVSWSEYWVMEVRGRVVACAKLYEGEETSELYDVFVVREWRGQGFGQALVREAISEARYPVYLACLPNAIGFYEGLGFGVMDGARLDGRLRGRLSLENPQYRKLGLTPMVRSGKVSL